MQIGLQLYTVRDQTAQDFKGTIREVARIGYQGVEFAGYGGLSAEELNELLKETGLKALGSHVSYQALQADSAKEIEYCRQIGCPYLVIPYMSLEELNDVELLRTFIANVNEYSKQCKDAGITLCYHNHSHEFEKLNGSHLLDLIAEGTDASLVKLEVDTYWVTYAGLDPVAYLRQYTGRVPLIHLKDMTTERTFTEVGDGTIDIASIVSTGNEIGVEWGIVENDAPAIPSLDSARRSFANLQKLAV
ncbi:sugar phosphate isomerase/epimerase family protein [Ktedonospora formicarum]|uniref:Sugar phosphate isomerase n=1 Tax=Ktedonospora formicarum TaxID=2778364 RepID=A0A8J3HU77_9CHLR|nr:sugar phosphate isomerase/epimerase [Ktedonospora formicarum]GHO43829.1 sugar phosphate isomerase [Ktedonospora formicarum]